MASNPAGSSERAGRPGVVTAVCVLLLVAAAGQVVATAATLAQIGALRHGYTAAFAGTRIAGAQDMMVSITAATAFAFGALFTAAFVLLAVQNARGRRVARVLTWVVGALSICWSGTNLVSTAVGVAGLTGGAGNGGPSRDAIRRALEAALPGWYQPVLTVTGLVTIVAVVAAMVILAMPLVHDFYDRPGHRAPARVPSAPPAT